MKSPEYKPLYTDAEEVAFLLKENGQIQNAHKDIQTQLLKLAKAVALNLDIGSSNFAGELKTKLQERKVLSNRYDSIVEDATSLCGRAQYVQDAYKEGSLTQDRETRLGLNGLLLDMQAAAQGLGLVYGTLVVRQNI